MKRCFPGKGGEEERRIGALVGEADAGWTRMTHTTGNVLPILEKTVPQPVLIILGLG
jgi:hypothetical protein